MAAFLGIDVGTGSARAGIFDAAGRLLGAGAAKIGVWHPRPGWAQHASGDIWDAVCRAVAEARSAAGVTAVDGIGADATCSLVVSGADGAPVSVDPDGAAEQDVIVWMDHRAVGDADAINEVGGVPLAHVGGRISPEMQMPKLRWFQRERPEAWARAERFRDLSDWLVYRATGTDRRSLCAAVCKWTYMAHLGTDGEGWDEGFLRAIGLDGLTGAGRVRIGDRFVPPGAAVGGLSPRAATELGLAEGTPVGAGLIDAHAGALGTLGAGGTGSAGRLAVIAGTSTCHIALTPEPAFAPGIWGPYWSAVTPGTWCNEGGQSAAGALLDAVIARHSAAAALAAEPGGVHAALADRLEALAGAGGETATLTADRHVQPDWHGNRSPLAEPWRRGAIDGLTLESGPDDLARDYLAAVQALAYGTRHIIEELRAAGVPIDTLVPSGGLARSALFLRETADATGCAIARPDVAEPVLLGAAMLGAVASGHHADAAAAMAAMAPGAETVAPRPALAAYHDRKYRVFRRMQADHAAYADLMSEKEEETP